MVELRKGAAIMRKSLIHKIAIAVVTIVMGSATFGGSGFGRGSGMGLDAFHQRMHHDTGPSARFWSTRRPFEKYWKYNDWRW
jgi:hypothetical protein